MRRQRSLHAIAVWAVALGAWGCGGSAPQARCGPRAAPPAPAPPPQASVASVPAANRPTVSHAPVEAWEQVPAGPLNSHAAEVAQDWAERPTQVALAAIDADADTPTVVVHREPLGNAESGQVRLTIVRDGFLDDATRGDIHRIVLERSDDGRWIIREAARAHRCWRSGDAPRYGTTPCP